MKARYILTIWHKELKDTIRDRRTLLAMVVMPMVLVPLLIVGMFKFTDYQQRKAQEQIVKIAVVNSQAAPELISLIRTDNKIEIVEINLEINQAIDQDKIDAALIITQDFSQKISRQETAIIELIRNSTKTKSNTALSRLRILINSFNTQITEKRFEAQSIDKSILAGAVLEVQDIASQKEMGGFVLGLIIPLLIIMWSIIGGQYTAIDISAGEKERKTLESLLLTPAKRVDVVLGKFLAVASTALVSVVVSLVSMIVAFRFVNLESSFIGGSPDTALAFSLPPAAILIFFVVAVLLVLMFSAILLSIAIFAKSYKEAQSYIGPSYLLIILPVTLINALPGFKPAVWLFTLPAINAMLLFKEVLLGNYIASHILITMISLILFAVLALLVATKIYAKETILFKE